MQGVDLSNIVRDLSLQSSGNGDVPAKHPVVAAVEALASSLQTEPIDNDLVIGHCQNLKVECDIDLAHRCLAGKNEAYHTLLSALEKFKESKDVMKHLLEAVCSLCNGQPDLLDDRGVDLLLELLKLYQGDAELALLTAQAIRLTCTKHERNRQTFVSKDLIPSLMDVMESNKGNQAVVKEVCFALRVLTFDDDVRVPFGKAHEHAKLIVMEAGALRKILNMCEGNNFVG